MEKQEYVQEVVSKSYERANKDPVFRSRLVRDRTAALEEVFDTIPVEPGEEQPTKGEVVEGADAVLQTIPFLPRDEVTRLVLQLVEDSREAYRNTMRQSQALFWVGVGLAVVTVGVELWGLVTGMTWGEMLTGGLFGSGLGLGFVYTAFIKRPLDQMQNSVGNLAQIQIVFLGYLDQLTVLMVHAGRGSLEETTAVSQALSEAAEAAADRIERYCENRPNASAVSPPAPTNP